MYKCGRRGVLAASVAFALATMTATEVMGTEFANILGSGEEDARRASVEALDALSKVFAAIKKIEKEGLSAGAEDLMQAADQLAAAGKLMSAVKLDQTSPTIDYTLLIASDKILLESTSATLGTGTTPTNLNELYGGFTAATTNIASDIAAAVKSGKPVLPQVADKLAVYIQLGGAVSRVYEKFQKQ